MNEVIIYNLASLHNFSDYGITVPVLNQRVVQALEELKSEFVLHESLFDAASEEDLHLAHSKYYLEQVRDFPEMIVEKTYELTNSDGTCNRYDPKKAVKPLKNFVEKAKLHVAGTILAGRTCLETGFAFHFGGGMHHAMKDHPAGFCMFNDLVITARKLQREGKVSNVLIVDLDCHKGDGTAVLTGQDDSIFTFSIHMKNGWPIDAPRYEANGELNLSFFPSDCDVPVEKSDNYLLLLEKNLSTIPDIANFDLALVVHGADVYEQDALPSADGIKLSEEEVLKRDTMVFDWLKVQKIPQAWCLGGGYGPETYKLYVNFLKYALAKR